MPVHPPINYYDILGVSPEATTEEIRSAYRARLAQHHPDRDASAYANTFTSLLNDIWALLRDPEQRHLYDAALKSGEQTAATPEPATGASTAALKTASTSNRRTSTRVKTLVTSWVMTTGGVEKEIRLKCTCLDLSPSGMSFTLSNRLNLYAPIVATLHLPDGEITTSAHVVRCDGLGGRGRWKIAVTFDGLSPQDRLRISGFVDDERRRRLD